MAGRRKRANDALRRPYPHPRHLRCGDTLDGRVIYMFSMMFAYPRWFGICDFKTGFLGNHSRSSLVAGS